MRPSSWKVIDSYFAGNNGLTGTGAGGRIEFSDIDSPFLELEGTKVVAPRVAVEHDSTKRTYLHAIAGSEAAASGAGSFTNRRCRS
jgi:hypothetical protein